MDGEPILELTEEEKAQARATSLFVIKSIVARHGGTVDIDLATYTINITVPQGEQEACEGEIIGAMSI